LSNGPSPDELRALLASHWRTLDAATDSEFLDLELALSLHKKLGSLLDRWHSYNASQRDRIVRTINYVVDMDDEEHDLRSPIGFVDDSEHVDELLASIAPDLLS
jgi:hypothetical protein